jgi:type IV secretion system protein VirD4
VTTWLRSAASGPQVERLRRIVLASWYSLPEERRDHLVARRRRYLWQLAVVTGGFSPWLLIPFALLAYVLHEPPRRSGSPALLLLFTYPVIEVVRELCGAVGLIDDPGDSTLIIATGLGIAAAVVTGVLERSITGARGLRPLLPSLRRGLDPAAWGLPPFRIPLGSRGRAWITAPRQTGALVIGPPRSGKTSGVIVPNVLAWTGPTVITSTRRDVLDACHGVRSRRGTVWCFDPVGTVAATMPAAVRRLDWSPLRGSAGFDTALARARALLAGSMEGTEGRDHWRARGTQLLGALLHAAALARLPMTVVVEWVHGGRLDAAQHVLEEVRASGALAVVQGIAQTPDRERGSIWSAVSGCLAPFDDSVVLASADRANSADFVAADFLRRPNALFIVAPSDAATPLAPLVVGLVEEVREAALQQSNRTGALDLPLLLALDEIATICPLPSMPQIAAEGGGRNMLLLAILQDLSQAAERWSREVADGLLTLVGAKLILPGLADAETLQRVETLVGNHWIQQTSRSETTSGWLTGSQSWGTYRSEIERPRIPAASIRRLPAGRGLAIVGGRDATVVQLAQMALPPFQQWLRQRETDGLQSARRGRSAA